MAALNKDPVQVFYSKMEAGGEEYSIFISEDFGIKELTQGERVGSFGWAQRGCVKIGHAMDWPSEQAPSFRDQCKVIMDAIKEKL